MSDKCTECGGPLTWFVVGPANKVERLVCDDCQCVLDERKHISDEDMRTRLPALEEDVRSLKGRKEKVLEEYGL